jgi:lipid II isoglutaminyl synthase (glutamine-hydrolysing)
LSRRDQLAVAVGRAAGWTSRITGRGAGAHVSGRVMLKIQPRLLGDIAARDRVTLVSATNGKTTTTRLLAAALEAANRPVVTNHTGANLVAGVVATLATPHPPSDAVLEVDERVLPLVVDPLDARLLLLGNLSRDQLDRYGEVRSLADRWRDMVAAHPDVAIVANASDPHVAFAAASARTVWVDLGSGWRGDAATCPACGRLLEWTGDPKAGADTYACSCGFAEPAATNRLVGDTLHLGDRVVSIDLALPGRWNVLNAALAITAAAELGVDPDVAASAASSVETVSGRYATYHLADGRPARVLLAKNPAGWSEVLAWLDERANGVVLAVNAHVADGRDTSWLWDAPFERLRGRTVAASGERSLDVAVRLDYDGVACVVEPDPVAAAALVGGPEVDIVASYTQFTALTRRLR